MADTPLRVLHVIDTLGRGGAEQLLVTLLPALQRCGIDPVVAVLRAPHDLRPALEQANIPVLALPAFRQWNLAAGRNAIARLCAEESIDLVHAHLYFPGLYAGLVGASSAIPIFETFHNMAYAGANRGGIKLTLRRRLRARVARRSGARFLAVSAAVADHYRAALGLEAVTVLPNAIDFAELDRLAAQPPHKKDGAGLLKLVVPGRLVPEKGHTVLLEALSDAGLPPFSLTFLGGGPLEPALRDQASAMGVPVTITGMIGHDAFIQALAGADLCLVPSRYEGFGIAAAEAMALGIPCIASDAGGLPEVVGDAGVTVPAGDAAALRDAIRSLALDPARRQQLGQVGQARVRRLFSVDLAAAKLAEMYRAAHAGQTHQGGW